jgi:integrase/recombinase XerD
MHVPFGVWRIILTAAHPDQLSSEDFKNYFASLIDTRSWSLVKIERSGLQFFYKHVLGQAWLWVDMVKAPVVKSLPDVLSLDEIARSRDLSRLLDKPGLP